MATRASAAEGTNVYVTAIPFAEDAGPPSDAAMSMGSILAIPLAGPTTPGAGVGTGITLAGRGAYWITNQVLGVSLEP